MRRAIRISEYVKDSLQAESAKVMSRCGDGFSAHACPIQLHVSRCAHDYSPDFRNVDSGRANDLLR